MTDWVTFRDRDQPCHAITVSKGAIMRRIRQHFDDHPHPQMVPDIASALRCTPQAVRGALRRMHRLGLVDREDIWHHERKCAIWSPRPELHVEVVTHVEGVVRDLLRAGPVTSRAVAIAAGCTQANAWFVLKRLVVAGYAVHQRSNSAMVLDTWALDPDVPLPPHVTLPKRAKRKVTRIWRQPIPSGKRLPTKRKAKQEEDDDEAWTPPTNYLSASRRYALGLPVATQRRAA